jgi:hypothetical protein
MNHLSSLSASEASRKNVIATRKEKCPNSEIPPLSIFYILRNKSPLNHKHDNLTRLATK